MSIHRLRDVIRVSSKNAMTATREKGILTSGAIAYVVSETAAYLRSGAG
jgi:hypothetical protein